MLGFSGCCLDYHDDDDDDDDGDDDGDGDDDDDVRPLQPHLKKILRIHKTQYLCFC